MSLRDVNLFKLTPIFTEVSTKISSISDDPNNEYEIICLVQENNEILFRRSDKLGKISVRLLCWFRETSRSIQDVCFQSSGENILVLCYDNTIHTVSLITLFAENVHPYAEVIDSYIIPFIGPHECPNAKTCPNNYENDSNRSSISYRSGTTDQGSDVYSTKKIDEFMRKNAIYSTFDNNINVQSEINREQLSQEKEGSDVEVISEKSSDENQIDEDEEIKKKLSKESTFEETKTFSTSLESSSYPCPYPSCCLWWQTITNENRAIIGYSDGTICFVSLTPNCPFIANTSVEKGLIDKLVICKDSSLEIISLMITTSLNEQWKLLLEQKSIGYIFPGDSNCLSLLNESGTLKDKENLKNQIEPEDWQVVIALNEDNQLAQNFSDIKLDESTSQSQSDETSQTGIMPTWAKLSSLKDLGAKKIGALKLKIAESRLKASEKNSKNKIEPTTLAVMDAPGQYPEILTTPSGPYFSVQIINEKSHLAALHSYSDTLSVHSMDISLIPLFLYKIPKNSKNILLTTNLMYTIQYEESTPTINNTNNCQIDDNLLEQTDKNTEQLTSDVLSPTTGTDTDLSREINLLNIVSCRLSAIKIGDECDFNEKSLLSKFTFNNERIINIHRRAVICDKEIINELNNIDKDIPVPDIKNEKQDYYYLRDYNNIQTRLEESENFDVTDVRVMTNKFPDIEYESCYVVTNKNVYAVEFSDHPHILFLNLANAASWPLCEDFCNTFNVSLPQCIEFAGDVFLKKQKVTQAILTFNIARIPPIYTARKFALFCECNALMHLCAMALKVTYILKSKYPASYHIKELLKTANKSIEMYSKYQIEFPTISTKCINTGHSCSDFNYEKDEIGTDLKISNTSLFHLSNYLLLTLCEKSIRDRQFLPLWNFIVTNTRYHSYLASVVLSESGLYSSAILLAKTRGITLTVFYCLVKISNTNPDECFDIGVLMYNLSDEIFMECISYLYTVSHDYFEAIKRHIDILNIDVLERLEKQLNPFDEVHRPLIMKISDLFANGDENDIYRREYIEWYKSFVETYIIILIKLKTLKIPETNFLSGLSTFQMKYEQELSAAKIDFSERLSAGFSYSVCVINRIAYMWGFNGIHPVFDVKALDLDKSEPAHIPRELTFFAGLNLDVLSVKCGRSHFLLQTTSGIYSIGNNNLGQLGIGNQLSISPQPMLIRDFEGKTITHISAGQYHNAIVADGNLYTWGWGVFGQLGQGNIENYFKPTIVKFFKGKNITQIALGYSHSLILCDNKDLYVFGSNHFGQLGIGQFVPSDMINLIKTEGLDSTALRCSLKRSMLPVKIDFDDENIRLIHTRYFTNLIVTESNELYTWGLSPQSLRLATQAKKRARQSQKNDDSSKIETKENDDNESDETKIESESSDDNKEKETSENVEEEKTAESQEESTDHYYLTKVDTTEIESDIIEISSGLYHYALITSTCDLYTWGKNLERQLGHEGPRCDVIKPTRLDIIENPLHVQCGGDFTLVMTKDYKVEAFGNNNSAQCGKEVSWKDYSGRLVRLRTSKRLVRIPDGSQYIQTPVEIQLPQQIEENNPINYLKSIPKFSKNDIIRCNLHENLLELNKHNGTIDSNLNELCNDCDDDNADNLENIFDKNLKLDNNISTNNIDYGNSECQTTEHSSLNNIIGNNNKYKNNNNNINDNNNIINDKEDINDKIHYCLFIFNGLYDHNNIINKLNDNQIEYKIRMLILNFKFIDAFKLSLTENSNPLKSIKIFEYFVKDTNIFPDEITLFIYEIFMHFIDKKYDINLLEEFFLNDLDLYVIQIAYVLYFNNNNNNELERIVFNKYKNLFRDYTNHNLMNIDNCDLIFKSISTKFTITICQKILEMDLKK